MTYSDAVKSGFRLINRNWQLVGVQVAMTIANCIGFFVIVGIPLVIAIVIFVQGALGMSEMKYVLDSLKNPDELFSKYFGIVMIVVISFLLYVLIASTLGLFVFAGSIGTVGRSVLNPSEKFSMKVYMSEAKRIFFPLIWFSLVMGLIFLAVAFFLGLLGGGAAVVVQSAKSQDSTLALFLGIFFSLVLVLLGIAVILGVISITVYGLAVLFFKNEGAIRSSREAARFLWERPSAFWLYVLLFFAYIIASFVLMLFTYPFNLIPIIGTLISFPLQVASYVVQSYIGLAILAAVFIYYYEAEIRKPETPAETVALADAVMPAEESSIGTEDISAAGVLQQEETPPEKGPTEQA